jgi:hypothetical protein
MSWALELPKADLDNPAARHVLLCLANYAGVDGRGAFPSAGTISAHTGLSERTVRLKLDELERAGLIVEGNQAIAAAYIDRRDRRPVVYDLQLKRGANAAPRKERGADHRTGCSSLQNGVQLTTERGAAAAPNPSLNHQGTKEERAHEISPTAQAVPEDPRQHFPMFAEWQPAERDVKAQTYTRSVDPKHVTTERLQKFVAFHLSKPSNLDTHSGWAYRLIDWIHRDLTQGAAHAASTPAGKGRRAGGITLEQNLGDTSFAEGIEPS